MSVYFKSGDLVRIRKNISKDRFTHYSKSIYPDNFLSIKFRLTSFEATYIKTRLWNFEGIKSHLVFEEDLELADRQIKIKDML